MLQRDGVTTIAGLAELDREVADLDATRLETFVRQARLQVEARNAPDEKPPFELLDPPSGADSRSSTTRRAGPDRVRRAAGARRR